MYSKVNALLMRYYVEQTYGKDFSLWPVEPDGKTGSESDRPASSQTWKIVLQEAGHDISFELRNYLTNSIQFLDGASLGPVVSRFESAYAIEKARAVHDQVLNIVAGFTKITVHAQGSRPTAGILFFAEDSLKCCTLNPVEYKYYCIGRKLSKKLERKKHAEKTYALPIKTS